MFLTSRDREMLLWVDAQDLLEKLFRFSFSHTPSVGDDIHQLGGGSLLAWSHAFQERLLPTLIGINDEHILLMPLCMNAFQDGKGGRFTLTIQDRIFHDQT